MKVLIDEEYFEHWAEVHFAGQGYDPEIVEQETIPVNPYAEHGIYNAWAVLHDPSNMAGIPEPNIQFPTAQGQVISVWYTYLTVYDNEETVKQVNTFKMIETALLHELKGIKATIIPSPAAYDVHWSTHKMNMIDIKVALSKAGKFKHVLHPDFVNKGAHNMSELKTKTSSINFAKAREAAAKKKHEKTLARDTALLARIELGASYEELAVFLGVQVQSVGSYVTRAQQRLNPAPEVSVAPEPVKAVEAPTEAPGNTPVVTPEPEVISSMDELTEIVEKHEAEVVKDNPRKHEEDWEDDLFKDLLSNL